MPTQEAPCIELGSAPRTPSVIASPSPSEISSTSSSEPQNIRATPLFRALALPPPDPEQPPGQDELERRLPGYRRIIIPRELTLIELLKHYSGVTSDDEVLRLREAKLRVVAERVGLRRLNVLVPRLKSLTLDGSALSSLRDLGIGLIRLKFLSVNRCGLHSLDGVWGLGALREFHAAGNRIHDLQPLAALQKLHTLNLADNPISDSSRLWTLGVCAALRRLTLSGTDASDTLNYRLNVASALPMLLYLDDRPLNNETEFDFDEMLDDPAFLSDSGESGVDIGSVNTEHGIASIESKPGPSTSHDEEYSCENASEESNLQTLNPARLRRQRPATTEGAGVRPSRPELPRRPKTALERPNIEASARLQIMNTLMDEEWRCTGSKLTSHGAVCGNLARALRRPTDYYHQKTMEAKQELVMQTMSDATRALAAEIPRAPCLEDWIKFKEETGIDIDIDFNDRPQENDGTRAIERLERIEKETRDRLKYGDTNNTSPMTVDHELWRIDSLRTAPRDIYSLFDDLDEITLGRNTRSHLENNESQYD